MLVWIVTILGVLILVGTRSIIGWVVHRGALLRICIMPWIADATLVVRIVVVKVIGELLVGSAIVVVDGYVSVGRWNSLVRRVVVVVMICTVDVIWCVHLGVATRIIGVSVTGRWVVVARVRNRGLRRPLVVVVAVLLLMHLVQLSRMWVIVRRRSLNIRNMFGHIWCVVGRCQSVRRILAEVRWAHAALVGIRRRWLIVWNWVARILLRICRKCLVNLIIVWQICNWVR